MTESYWIFYRGLTRLRDTEIYRRHGIEMEKGKIYPVSREVFEYLKSQRGFEKCRGLGSKEVIDFPKKVNDAKTEKPSATKTDIGDKVVVPKVRKDAKQ